MFCNARLSYLARLALTLVAFAVAGCEEEADQGLKFVKADVLKAELDSGAALTLVDARPTADYEQEHITGALSMPYFQGEARWAELLPTSRSIVAYCGCPHTESGYLARILIAHGFTNVRVLDEGFFFWRDRGYPTVINADAGVTADASDADAGSD